MIVKQYLSARSREAISFFHGKVRWMKLRRHMLILALMLPAVQLRAEDLFIEAESCGEHTFNEAAAFEKIVSGGKILRLWKGADPPSEGYFARFPFTTRSNDPYHVWVAASLPPATSNFWWRLDLGEWQHVTPDTLDDIPVQFGVSNAMGWIKLTTSRLSVGEHTLTLRVNERRPGLEHAYLLYLDALLLTTRDVYPQGLVTEADVPNLKPKPAPPQPVPRAGKPGPPMMLGTSVMNERRNHLVKSLGFSLSQTDSDHLTVNETAPGQWDWREADAGLAACQAVGLKWQYFPHFHWPPEWYRKTDKFVPCTGLRSGRQLTCLSIWSPDILPWFDHGYAALASHYGNNDSIVAALYVGIHGDFGEAIFPMGWHPGEKERFGEQGTGLADYWCGDDFARADFRRFAQSKYRTQQKLDEVWGTRFDSFDGVDYPPAAYGRSTDVTSSPQQRRYWLDFVEWYFDNMTRFTTEVCRIARKHFPKSLLVLPAGGGEEASVYGQDNSALPQALREVGVHIRSTHGGYLSFPENQSTMLKRLATACKFYGVPFWSEPPGSITPEGEVSRFMEAISCGSWGYWDWGSNPVGAANTFREYAAFLTREKPVVDVALFFPTTDHRLQPTVGYPPRVSQMGADLRDVMDYDIVDERLIEDGALKRYRVLLWVEGAFIEARTLTLLTRWVKEGGVLLKLGGEAVQTVEGDSQQSRELFGLSPRTSLKAPGADPKAMMFMVKHTAFLRHVSAYREPSADVAASGLSERAIILGTVLGEPAAWAMRCGKGWAIVWAGLGGIKQAQRTFYELARDVAYNLSALDATKSNAREVDKEWDKVYATLLSNGEVILYNFNGEPCTKRVEGAQIDLPPKSLRSVRVR